MSGTIGRRRGRLSALVRWPVLGLFVGALAGAVSGTLFGAVWAVTQQGPAAVVGAAALYFARAGAVAGALVGFLAALDVGRRRGPGGKDAARPRP
jgi:hypothetical protein